MKKNNTYGQDRDFLNEHADCIELANENAKLIFSPKLQGRIVTSTANGDDGFSFGWINYDLISSGELLPHCNNFGGEDRFWIGPEGGQYSIFFKNRASFDLEHWQTPAAIDSHSWKVVECDSQMAKLEKKFELENYSGFKFKVHASREIEIFDRVSSEEWLGIAIPEDLESVGFVTRNNLKNIGDFQWERSSGLLSIWNLAQLKPSAENVVILPINPDIENVEINDSYFGKIDSNRIKITQNHVFYKGDGMKRGKIGLDPSHALPIIGSYNEEDQILTIVKYSFNPANKDYVNSMWELQEEPFKGDVVNSYNDGPLPDGTIMGPFYELETSSPALETDPGQKIEHIHSTFHFKGDKESLNYLAEKLLSVSLDECVL